MKILKTLLTLVTVTLLMNSTSFAQKSKDASSGGDCVKQGTILIDAFYGFPYFNGTILKAAYKDSLGGNSVHNLNHLGGRFEYLLSDKIGLGVEFTYADATVRYQGNNSQYYTAGISKYRILGKMSYHFATTAKLDPYLTWGAGYKSTKVYTNEPATVQSVKINLLPVAVRFGVGLRYFFTDFLGVNAEVGLGGPIMQAGLSLKF